MIDDGRQRVRRVDSPTLGPGRRRAPAPRVLAATAGAATAAQLDEPTGLATDDAGNLYIAEFGNHRVRRLDPERA